MNLFLRSRRPDPRTWTRDQVRSLVVAAYLGDHSEDPLDMREPGDPLRGGMGTAAVVFHLPEGIMPRRILRKFSEQRGLWLPYRWYGLAWCQGNIDYAIMGDATVYDVAHGRDSHGNSEAACKEAERWLRASSDTDIERVRWDDLPWPAQSFATSAVRRGL
jgi:hypothetical protein